MAMAWPACRFNASAHPRVKEFDQGTGRQVEETLDDDTDVAVVGNVEQNIKCPISGRPVRHARPCSHAHGGNACMLEPRLPSGT